MRPWPWARKAGCGWARPINWCAACPSATTRSSFRSEANHPHGNCNLREDDGEAADKTCCESRRGLYPWVTASTPVNLAVDIAAAIVLACAKSIRYEFALKSTRAGVESSL